MIKVEYNSQHGGIIKPAGWLHAYIFLAKLWTRWRCIEGPLPICVNILQEIQTTLHQIKIKIILYKIKIKLSRSQCQLFKILWCIKFYLFFLSVRGKKRLQKIQNTLCRIITRTPRRSSITAPLKSLHWLPVFSDF